MGMFCFDLKFVIIYTSSLSPFQNSCTTLTLTINIYNNLHNNTFFYLSVENYGQFKISG